MDTTQNTQDVSDADPTERQKLHAAILGDITARAAWETKQVDFYRMRHNGIKRKQKPWNNAADLHFPLIDTNIEKLKPMFFQQIVGMDVVASFVPMRNQLAGATTSAEQWFDYKVREKSNLQQAGLSWIDYALMAGRGVLKITWNSRKKEVEYTSIDPLYVIVPAYTKDLQDADRIVHVMPMSLAAYKRAGVYDTSPATLKQLKGDEDDSNIPGASEQRSAKQLREGITHDKRGDFVIVWEVYEPSSDGHWNIRTYSPAAPEIDLREPMQCPYDHHQAPLVDFAYEIKDAGWYSPRGIAEILSPFEAALCHTWNQKHDSMQLFNKPVFRSERDVPNSMNLRVGPGQILPNGLIPVPMPAPPMSFNEEMTFARSIAEQRVANPDYGMGQVIDTKNRRTATEIEAIGGQAQQAGDLRQRMFRMALAKVYKQTWSLLLQFDKQDLAYRFLEDSQTVDVNALHEQYHIEPKGGVNEVNKQLLLQKAIQRKQIFVNSPWINQPELDKSILELDDPSLIKRVFQDPNLKGQAEQADEAQNIPALLLGASIPVKQGDNYSLRVGVLMQFIQDSITKGKPIPPDGVKALVSRLQALIQADMKVDNNGGKKLGSQVFDYLQSVGMLPPATPTPQMATPPQQGGGQPTPMVQPSPAAPQQQLQPTPLAA